MVFESLQADAIFKADGCIILIPPIVSYRWLVGCIKREKNDINIAKPSIYKAAGPGINEIIFPSFSWTYLLSIIHGQGLGK